MNIKQLVTIILVLLIHVAGKAQDPQFTQFYSNPMYQAPSFAGAIKGYRAVLNYRDQWPKMPGKIYTATFSLDYNLSALNSGIGVYAMRDEIGSAEYAWTNFGIVYAYNVKIDRKIYFRPGVGFYYSQRSLNQDKLRFVSEMYHGGGAPLLPGEISKSGAADASVSALLLVHNFWTGLVVDHLAQPNITLTNKADKLPVKWTVFGGYKFVKSERLIGTKRQSVTFAANYKHQGAADQLDLGLYWNYDPLTLGVWYRDIPLLKKYSQRDALAFLVGYKYKQLSAAYSYDFTVSRLATSTGGTHEISVIFLFEIEQKRKFRPIPCPHF